MKDKRESAKQIKDTAAYPEFFLQSIYQRERHLRIDYHKFLSVIVVSIVLICLCWTDLAFAEGSRSLYPTTYPVGGFRANLDFQPGTAPNYNLYVGKVLRRGFLYVYAQAGEYILLGSRNRSATPPVGDIFIYNPQNFGIPGNETLPGAANFSCSAGSSETGPHYFGAGTGLIDTRLKELAGPNSADNTVTVSNGFRPCAYKAPTTGLYGVLFSLGTGGGPNGVIDPPALSNNSVSAWDVTVRANATSVTDLNGRLFTYAFIGFTGGNSRPVYSTHYYITSDGYRYQQDLRGLDPNGYALYANTLGFLDNGQPLFKDVRGNEAMVTSLPPGVTTQIAQYPIFFSDISPAGLNNTEVNRVLGALGIPLSPPTPTVTNVSFSGHIGGSTTTTGVGGTFYFTTTDTITYSIIVSRDGINFDPDNVNNAVLTGIAPTGTHAVVWDGKDQNYINFPSSATPYLFRVVGHNGDVHFPIIDAENNPGGGPTITRLNGNNPGERTVFFDDRGYITSSGTLVGNLNGTLCPTGTPAAPSPAYSLNGVDSSTNYRLWQSGGNANSDCVATAGWGDAKGLNLWTYYSTPQHEETLLIEPIIVDVTTSVSAPGTAIAGSIVQGAFSFGNNGNSNALGVTYDMSLTPGLGTVTFANFPVGVSASYNNATGAVTLSGLPTTLTPGQIISGMTFTYTAPATGPVTVTTNIYTTSPEESYLANNSDIAVTGIGSTDVLTTVSVPATAVAGSSVNGNFLFANYGVNLATGVTYTATIGSPGNYPAAVTFTSLPSGVTASYNPVNGQVTFTGMPTTLASGQSLGFGFSYTAPGSGIVPVSTSISTTSSDANPANNNASGNTTIIPSADLSISKTDSSDPVIAGNTLTYTLSVSNGGPSTASNVSVSDTLPGGVSYQSASGTGWTCNHAAGVVTCTRGSLAVGAAPDITVTVTVNAGTTGTITNNVSVTSDTTDPVPGNNSDSEGTTVSARADLSITKSDSPDPVVAGGTLTYTLSVSNGGPSTASNVSVSDTLLVGVSYQSASGTGWSCGEAAGVVTCTRASLAVGAAPDITVTVTAPAEGGSLTNNVSVTSDTADPVPGNNSDSEDTAVSIVADLAITKTDGVATAVPGQWVTYTITATNNGPSNVTGATVADTFPGTLSVINWTCSASAGSSCTAAGSGNINDTVNILTGGTLTYTVIATVSASATGTLTNTATVAVPSGATDPTPGNNSATDTDTLTPSADLSISKTDSPDPVIAGNTLTYTVTVSNAGPSDAANVVVTDTLPAGVTFGSTSGCTEDPNGVPTCSLGTITAGGNKQYTVTVTVNAGTTGTITNTVSVASDTTDPVPGNNSDSEDTTVNAPSIFDPPSGYKTVSALGFPELVWRMVWINNSVVIATAVTVIDPIPAGTTYVAGSLTCDARGASVTTTCIYDNVGNRVIWEGTIAPDPGATNEATALNEVVITYRTSVAFGVVFVQNQGCANWDVNGNGSVADEIAAGQIPVCSDNPATAAPGDPTVWTIGNPSTVSVPTLNEWGIIGLFCLQGLLALYFLRRRMQ